MEYTSTPKSRQVQRSADCQSHRGKRAPQAPQRKELPAPPAADAAICRTPFPPRAGDFRQPGRPLTETRGAVSADAPAEALLTKTKLVNLLRPGGGTTSKTTFRGKDGPRALQAPLADRVKTARKTVSVPYRPPSPPLRSGNPVGRPRQTYQDRRPSGRSKTKSIDSARNRAEDRRTNERDSSDDGNRGAYIKKGTYSPPLRKPGPRAPASGATRTNRPASGAATTVSSGEEQPNLTSSADVDTTSSNSLGNIEARQQPEHDKSSASRPTSCERCTQSTDIQFSDVAADPTKVGNGDQSSILDPLVMTTGLPQRPQQPQQPQQAQQPHQLQQPQPSRQPQHTCVAHNEATATNQEMRTIYHNDTRDQEDRPYSDTTHDKQRGKKVDSQHMPFLRMWQDNTSNPTTLNNNKNLNQTHLLHRGINSSEHSHNNRMDSNHIQTNERSQFRLDNCCNSVVLDHRCTNYVPHNTPTRCNSYNNNHDATYRSEGMLLGNIVHGNNSRETVHSSRPNFVSPPQDVGYTSNTTPGRRHVFQDTRTFQEGMSRCETRDVSGRSFCSSLNPRFNSPNCSAPLQSHTQETQSRDPQIYNSNGLQRTPVNYSRLSVNEPLRRDSWFPLQQEGNFHSRLPCQNTLDTTELSPIQNGSQCHEMNLSFSVQSPTLRIQMPSNASSVSSDYDELSHGVHSSTRRNTTLPNSSGSHSSYLNSSHISPSGAYVRGRTFQQPEQIAHQYGRSYQSTSTQRNGIGSLLPENRLTFSRENRLPSPPPAHIWPQRTLEANNWNNRGSPGMIYEDNNSRFMGHMHPTDGGLGMLHRPTSHNLPVCSSNQALRNSTIHQAFHRGHNSHETAFYNQTKIEPSSPSRLAARFSQPYQVPDVTFVEPSVKSETEIAREKCLYPPSSPEKSDSFSFRGFPDEQPVNCTQEFTGVHESNNRNIIDTEMVTTNTQMTVDSVPSHLSLENSDDRFVFTIVQNCRPSRYFRDEEDGSERNLRSKSDKSDFNGDVEEPPSNGRSGTSQPLQQNGNLNTNRGETRSSECRVESLNSNMPHVYVMCETIRPSSNETSNSIVDDARHSSETSLRLQTNNKRTPSQTNNNCRNSRRMTASHAQQCECSTEEISRHPNEGAEDSQLEEHLGCSGGEDAVSPASAVWSAQKRKRDGVGDATPPAARKVAQCRCRRGALCSATPSLGQEATLRSPAPRCLRGTSNCGTDEEEVTPLGSEGRRAHDFTNYTVSTDEYKYMSHCIETLYGVPASHDMFFRQLNREDASCTEEPLTLLDVANKVRTESYASIDTFVEDVRRILSSADNTTFRDKSHIQTIKELKGKFERSRGHICEPERACLTHTNGTEDESRIFDDPSNINDRLVCQHDFLERLCDASTISVTASSTVSHPELENQHYAKDCAASATPGARALPKGPAAGASPAAESSDNSRICRAPSGASPSDPAVPESGFSTPNPPIRWQSVHRRNLETIEHDRGSQTCTTPGRPRQKLQTKKSTS